MGNLLTRKTNKCSVYSSGEIDMYKLVEDRKEIGNDLNNTLHNSFYKQHTVKYETVNR